MSYNIVVIVKTENLNITKKTMKSKIKKFNSKGEIINNHNNKPSKYELINENIKGYQLRLTRKNGKKRIICFDVIFALSESNEYDLITTSCLTKFLPEEFWKDGDEYLSMSKKLFDYFIKTKHLATTEWTDTWHFIPIDNYKLYDCDIEFLKEITKDDYLL